MAQIAPVPIGMAVGRIVVQEDLVPAQMGRVDDVWVEPGYRRQGVCRALMIELLAFFAGREISTLVLDYVTGSVDAEQTWRHFGFRPVLTLAKADLADVKARIVGSTN